jgi:phosphate/sulfate permease
VHWELVREIGIAWLATIPICATLAALVLALLGSVA